MIFRRRAPHDSLPAFLRLAERLDAAQRALLAAIPTSRDPGIPLQVALGRFQALLAEAESMMPAWLAPDVAAAHADCATALGRARSEAERLSAAPGTLEFEQLNARVGDVLHPLEAFAEAERMLRRRG